MTSFDSWYERLRLSGGNEFRSAMQAAGEPEEHLGQQGFASASELLRLAQRAEIGPSSLVLDLCCGPGGPGRWLSSRVGCSAIGVDRSLAGLRLRAAVGGREVRFPVVAAEATALPLASHAFDAVIVLESLLGFRDKVRFLGEVARVLRPQGRFACTAELGDAETLRGWFTPSEIASMHLVDAEELVDLLHRAGFSVRSWEDCTKAHARVANRLANELERGRAALEGELGRQLLGDLIGSTRAWAELLAARRLTKAAVVAELLQHSPKVLPTW